MPQWNLPAALENVCMGKGYRAAPCALVLTGTTWRGFAEIEPFKTAITKFIQSWPVLYAGAAGTGLFLSAYCRFLVHWAAFRFP